MAVTYDKPFSVENFKELFEKSESRKFLKSDVVEQILDAIENRDEDLLKRLYPALVTEAENVGFILSGFDKEKQRIEDQFAADCYAARKKYVEGPKEQARETEENKEKGEADKLLKNLNQ